MAQSDYVIADQAGVAFLNDLNSQLAAAVTNNSGATEPATKYPYMWWPDTANDIMKQRNAGNTAWVSVFQLSTGLPTGLNQAQVQTHLITTSSQSITANIRANISGLNATITPSTATKRIKVTVRWNGEFSTTNNYNVVFGLKRDAVDVGNPAAAGSRAVGISIIAQGFYEAESATTPDSAMYSYIDSPATTSATTYYATILNSNTGILYNQRTAGDLDSNTKERLTSTITLEEII